MFWTEKTRISSKVFIVACLIGLLPVTIACGAFADPREAYVEEAEQYFDEWLEAIAANDRQAMQAVYESVVSMDVDPRLAQTHGYLIK